MRSERNPPLGIPGFVYADLYDVPRLEALAVEFDRFAAIRDSGLFGRFEAYRQAMVAGAAHGGLTTPVESELLIQVGRELGVFLTKLFAIEPEAELLRARTARDTEVSRFKKELVIKRVMKVGEKVREGPDGNLDRLDRIAEATITAVTGESGWPDREHAAALTATRLIDLERDYPRATSSTFAPAPQARAEIAHIRDRLREHSAAALFDPRILHQETGTLESVSPERLAREAFTVHTLLDLLVEWSAARLKTPGAEWDFRSWTSYRMPEPLAFDHLVETEGPSRTHLGVYGPGDRLRRRDGFRLTDPRFTPREISDESHYCIFCHERKKDSCSQGLFERDGTLKRNPLGATLEGCPLDEKVGEMNFLRAAGASLAALALVMIDNPMCPGTGHRICNDCMRSCIFQKQEPVNIPQIETGVLTDVLFMPWGFEIYSLLTRWNPVNVRRPVVRPYNGKKVLVVGLGPAGYTLAHYLANEGFGVVAIDGLKIEPLPDDWIGRNGIPLPIPDARMLWEDLDERTLAGFGGVSEYGITVRWDKNFLKTIRLSLERRGNVRFYGGIRFGGTITVEDAFDQFGFDHIAVAAGAGTPTIVRMENNLIRGIRKASDFLMALQLTGAFKASSLANLQVRLPALVIGGGLTAIDTATELFAYYPVQVEKVLARYEELTAAFGEETVRSSYDREELTILDEFLLHGRLIRAERERAAAVGEAPDFVPIVRSWGGVTLAYRKTMNDSPAYRLNYEEVKKALEEGIAFAENLSPVEAVADEFGHVRAMLFETQMLEDGRFKDSGNVIEVPARSVMVAAGTSPNVIYEKEHPGTFHLDKYGQFFQAHCVVEKDGSIALEAIEDPTALGVFTSYRHPKDSWKLVSFYGDNHPRFAGNVVKAMASARLGYPHVVALFGPELAGIDESADAAEIRGMEWRAFCAMLDEALVARVAEVNRLTPTIVEVIVRAPLAARQFHPGQFFRLQNFDALAREIEGTKLSMEGIALTGAWADPEKGLLSLIILEMGGSSRLCATLQPGEPVVVMGPTGTPTEIPRNETILLAGGGLGNAVLFSIARAMKNNGCKVLYFAGYKKAVDLFKRDEIEAATDQVIWSVDRGPTIPAHRPRDLSFVGNIVQAMLAYATGDILEVAENERSPEELTPLAAVTRVIAIGSDGMMRAVRDARHGVLAPFLPASHVGLGSINSPMQCMMKQVCAQCLQRHVDPATGKETFIFSCFNQDQLLDEVDFDNLRARLRQNSVVEKLTNLWLTRLLAGETVAMV